MFFKKRSPEFFVKKLGCSDWDLDPGYWLEKPVSLTGLDDRSNEVATSYNVLKRCSIGAPKISRNIFV